MDPFLQLDQWCRFLGYGSPTAKLWVVGIEEGGVAYSEDDFWNFLAEKRKQGKLKAVGAGPVAWTYMNFETMDDLRHEILKSQPITPESRRKYTSKIWVYASELAAVFGDEGLEKITCYRDVPQEYLDIYRESGPIFLSNAYPLGKKSTKSKLPYENLFSFCEYQKYVEEHRLPLLAQARGNAVVVAHGNDQKAREFHKAAFCVEGDDEHQCGPLTIYRSSRLILTPFFGRSKPPMSTTLIKEVGKWAKELSQTSLRSG